MAIDFGRYKTVADVIIDYDKCITCGLCVKNCKFFPLYIDNGKLTVDQSRGFGCVGCAQCVCVCPQDAIRIKGRDISPDNVIPIPADNAQADYSALYALMLSRRSVRNYKSEDVSIELIKKIIAAAATAPTGVPPTEISVMVISSKTKMDEFYKDLMVEAKKLRKALNPFVMGLMKMFMKPADFKMFSGFILPILKLYEEKEALGENWFTYDAPCGLYFYPSSYADTPDAVLTATHAMLAAEALGLGSIFLGFIGPLVSKSKQIKTKYRLFDADKPGIFLALGHPDVTYHQSVIKKLASEIWV